MSYVITNGDFYVYYNANDKLSYIRNAAMAEHFTKKKAQNILKSSVPKKMQMRLEKFENGLGELDLPEVDSHSESLEIDLSTIEATVKELDNAFALINKRANELNGQLSVLTQKSNDLNHYIEMAELDEASAYKVYQELHDVRQQRRKVKNELKVINFVKSHSFEADFSNQLQKCMEEINSQLYSARNYGELFS